MVGWAHTHLPHVSNRSHVAESPAVCAFCVCELGMRGWVGTYTCISMHVLLKALAALSLSLSPPPSLAWHQVYSEAGDFSVRGRCWTSIKENMLLYGVVGTLAAFGGSVGA